jgi:hypothetical protein
MHIQPGVVEGAKMLVSYGTAAVAFGGGAKLAFQTIRHDGGLRALVLRSIVTTILVFGFFEVLPHYRVGVSEVHFIFGALLYLVFGAGPTAIGLALGLLAQSVLFETEDLPQYFINVTTLIVPLWVVAVLARRIVPPHTPYVELKYWQALVLSLVYQGGVIHIVGLWSLYGKGFAVENLMAIARFGVAYLPAVVFVEPLVTLAALAIAKRLDRYAKTPIFYNRLHHPVN